jgi:hypothetical protein
MKEVLGDPRKTVTRPNQHRVDTTAMGIFEESVQGWPSSLAVADGT